MTPDEIHTMNLDRFAAKRNGIIKRSDDAASIVRLTAVVEQLSHNISTSGFREAAGAINALSDDLEKSVTRLVNAQEKLLTQAQNNSSGIREAVEALQAALEKKNFNPKIDVMSDPDLNPLLKKLDDMNRPTFNLAHYRAHDLDNAPDKMQYIGFQDDNDNWYIMQHDPDNNRDRYYFGKEGYDVAWDERITHEYKNLSEARRALRT